MSYPLVLLCIATASNENKLIFERDSVLGHALVIKERGLDYLKYSISKTYIYIKVYRKQYYGK